MARRSSFELSVFISTTLTLLIALSCGQRLSQGASDWYMRFHDFDMVKRHVDRVVVESFNVALDIRHRYAVTTVRSLVHNPANVRQLYEFGFAMPHSAFVSRVRLDELDEERCVVKSFDGVAKISHLAQAARTGHGVWSPNTHRVQRTDETHNDRSSSTSSVFSDQADFKQFVLPLNMSSNSSVLIELVYETLLSREQGVYVSSVSVSPGEIVANLSISVGISEMGGERAIRRLNISAPVIGEVTPSALTTLDEHGNTQIELTVSMSSVEQFHYFGPHGFTGSFRVAFDVEVAQPDVYVHNGHFLHFYDLKQQPRMPSIPRYVIFAVEDSDSLSGPKLEYAKQAVQHLLQRLNHVDTFSLIAFNTRASILVNEKDVAKKSVDDHHHMELRGLEEIEGSSSSFLFSVNSLERETNAFFASMQSRAPTSNLTEAINSALTLDQLVWTQGLIADNAYTLVVVLTDGRSHRSSNSEQRVRGDIRALNKLSRVPLFFMGLGFDANMDLLESIVSNAAGCAINVNEDLQLEPQLQVLYDHLDDIVLKNAHVNYIAAAVRPQSLTTSHFKAFTAGGSLVVAGRFDAEHPDLELETEVTGQSAECLFMDSPEPIRLIDTDTEEVDDTLLTQQLVDCELQLCSDTQLKGHCIALNTSRATLTAFSFSNQPASALVVGPCTWTLYPSVHYSGSDTLRLTEGEYAGLDHMHKNVESVKRVPKANFAVRSKLMEKSNLWVERAWAFLRLRDQLELLETRPALITRSSLRRAALLAVKFNFLTAFTDLELRRSQRLASENGAESNERSAQDINAINETLVIDPLMEYADLSPSLQSSDDSRVAREWDSLRSCSPPIECEDGFHFEVDNDRGFDSEETAGSNCSDSRLVVYTRAHFRGESLSIDGSLHQLYHGLNGHRMRSLVVDGSCCWLLFERRFYAGDVERLCGQQRRAVHLTHVASIKRVRAKVHSAPQTPRGHAALY